MKLSDFVDFNPQEHLAKGTQATYIAMQDLSSFSRSPNSHTLSSYNGGSKFRNGDTLMARITPCLEHGKTAFVNCLKPNELGFGSTEFIVGRAKPGISIPLFVYCLLISDHIRDIAIKSMTGTSGRERVQQAALNDITIPNYSLQDQQHIVGVIGSVDDLIELNARKIAKIMDFSRLIYSQAKAISPMKSAGEFISFTKGKQADFVNQPTGEPYLTIDVLEGSQEVSYSASGVECGEGDILMVMDGAASGRCYFGYKGFVGSTLSKIECKGIDSSVAFLALEEHEKDIQKNTTGSAIPHTDKRYVSDIEIPLIKDEFTVNRLRNLLTLLVSTRKEIRTLREEKEILMRKFF